MAPCEALYGRKYRSPIYWSDVGERQLLGPELVQQTLEKVELIQRRMKTAQSCQKSFADVRIRPLEFEEGDKMFLKVEPMKGVTRFGKKGKLTPRYVGPFEILERVGTVAYRVALPPDLTNIHNVFHVSMLKKYIADPSHILHYEPLQLKEDLSYEEEPVKILDRKEKVLWNRSVSLVKVQWKNNSGREASWEMEAELWDQYPQLFES
ncbi:uncharacterized protein LOC122651765 [Telopea speciosissima]|uniref:uncharacterized protein LOC122651765 n=1 Tax=Telopea speciosissima TaxID=54955 RepID=UPI001CC70200|nr:uncharacterized protein LOC122651765 [Telopea speciosissima]